MSKKNIAPKYLRKTQKGHWYFFKLKNGYRGYGYHDILLNMRLIPLPDGNDLCIYEWMLSYFRPVSKWNIKKLIKQTEGE